MNTKTTQETEPKSNETRTKTPKEDALSTIVDQVKVDAQKEPSRYLKDAVVPAGGE